MIKKIKLTENDIKVPDHVLFGLIFGNIFGPPISLPAI